MASPEIKTVGLFTSRAKFVLVIGLVLTSIAAYYFFQTYGAFFQWVTLFVGLIASVALFSTTELGRQLLSFSYDATRELKKVVWPDRKEAFLITIYVFGFVVVMALFLWFTDKTLEWMLYDLILGWRNR